MEDVHGAVGAWCSPSDPRSPPPATSTSRSSTPIGLETVADCLRAVAPRDCRSIVRVPWNDAGRIKRLLDLGPDGPRVPMVDDADAARRVVAHFVAGRADAVATAAAALE
jgi:hypothetical protein